MKKYLIMATLVVAFLLSGFTMPAYAEEQSDSAPNLWFGNDSLFATNDELPSMLVPPPGAGTVVDETDSLQTEFFTIMTEAGNTFYLVIDRRHGRENVHLLNSVTEQDLLALTDGALIVNPPANNAPNSPNTPPSDTNGNGYDPAPDAPSNDDTGGGGVNFVLFGIVAVLFGVGAWYFKIYKPSQAQSDSGELEDDDTDNGSDYDDLPPWEDEYLPADEVAEYEDGDDDDPDYDDAEVEGE